METFATRVMNEPEYRVWWKLHRRASLGEPLTVEEQNAYDAGLQKLNSERTLLPASGVDGELDTRLTALEAEQSRLETRVDDLVQQLKSLQEKTTVSLSTS